MKAGTTHGAHGAEAQATASEGTVEWPISNIWFDFGVLRLDGALDFLAQPLDYRVNPMSRHPKKVAPRQFQSSVKSEHSTLDPNLWSHAIYFIADALVVDSEGTSGRASVGDEVVLDLSAT